MRVNKFAVSMPTHLPMGAINALTGIHEPPYAGIKNQEYKCPECSFKVKWTCGHTKSNGTTVDPYFSHFPGYSCEFYDNPSESFRHKEAKRQICWCVNNNRPLSFTRRCIECHTDDPVYVTDVDNTAIEEYRFDPDNRLLRADVGILKDGKTAGLIEIRDTHKTEFRPEPWMELYAGSTLSALAKGEYSFTCVRRIHHRCTACTERKKKEDEERILKEKEQAEERILKEKVLKEQAEERRKQKEEKAAMREKERVLREQKEKEEQLQIDRDLEERKIKNLEIHKQHIALLPAYYASMSKIQRIMHEVEGPRYDPIRSNGFIEWMESQKK